MTSFMHTFKFNFDVVSNLKDGSDVTPEILRNEAIKAIEEYFKNGTLVNTIEGPLSSDIMRSHLQSDDIEKAEFLPGYIFVTPSETVAFRFETSDLRMESLIDILEKIQDTEDGVDRKIYFAMIDVHQQPKEDDSELVAHWGGDDWEFVADYVDSAWDEVVSKQG